MKYIHIRNIEKFHPGYKDRKLRWAKIYFDMVQGDPECEMIENETDWARLIKLIILELQAQKPIPIQDRYLTMKGFNLEDRPIELTVQMLHNFIDVVTEDGELCNETVEYNKNKSKSKSNIKKSKSKSKNKTVQSKSCVTKKGTKFQEAWFDVLWEEYPNKAGKAAAFRKFCSQIHDDHTLQQIQLAMKNYLRHLSLNDWKRPMNGSTWFNEGWVDFVHWREPKIKPPKPEPPKQDKCEGCGQYFDRGTLSSEGFCQECFDEKEMF